MGPIMTDAEILKSYRAAAKPAAQVEILADLNGVSVDKIKEILVAQGIDHRQLPRSKKRRRNRRTR